MLARDFVCLALDAFGGSVNGRTKLQKKLYFLGLLTRQLGQLGFAPHYYGPYSSTVADALAELHSLSFLEERQVQFGTFAHGFEVTRYDYILSDDGRELCKRLKNRYPKEAEAISHSAQDISNAEATIEGTALDYVDLAIAAKAFFLLRQKGESATTKEIQDVAEDFGWTIEESGLSKAMCFLEKLGLVTTA